MRGGDFLCLCLLNGRSAKFTQVGGRKGCLVGLVDQFGIGDVVEMRFGKLKACWSVLVFNAAFHKAVIVLVVEMGDHFPGLHATDGD